ncbi:ARM repeat-containing protein [Xylariaceae sp. FL0255]|nr:ARM repeat-containing protein [Xylariaceae sp. FL0255]
MDDYRFRSQQSPRNEAPMNSLVSPPRNGRPMAQPVSQDPRTTLPRRFTTDSGRVPTLSSISTTMSTSSRLPEAQDYTAVPSTQYKVQLLEKKKLEYERLREQKRRFEAEMQKLDQRARMEEFELVALHEDLGRGSVLGLTGHQSEPTTPPEYRETATGFPTMFSRPNRYSMSSLVSPPGLLTRSARSGSVLTSPQSTIMPSRFPDEPTMVYRSVPTTRRNSDDDEKEEALRQDPTSHRSTNALNRYSMPVTRRGNPYDNIDQTNTTGFLFRDDDTTMDSGNYSGIDAGEDHFPQLHAQKGNPNKLSASSAAMDLASQLASGEANTTNGWGNLTRHRQQQSLSTIPSSQMPMTETMSSQADASTLVSRPFRHSIDLNHPYKDNMGDTTPTSTMSPSATQVLSTPPKLQSSFSTNDIPTVKNVSGAGVASPNANAHAQQHFHNHNASIGRIPPGAVKRHSRELSSESHPVTSQPATFPSIQSQLHANAPAFSIVSSQSSSVQSPMSSNGGAQSTTSPSSSIGSYQYFNGYNQASPNGAYTNGNNMGMLNMGMQSMNLSGYPSTQTFTGYGGMYQPTAGPRDSQQRVIQQRRAQNDESMNRFANMSLSQCVGRIYEYCKDQHGCRFLQKQLENRNPEEVHMIWLETNQHVVELMTDPFGNYLCQKLLEFCNDDERTVLIQNAAREMVRIALNQHGTRALQKMIEFVTIQTHVQIIIEALRHRVVELIQDLNGNHVIQKCLNKLSASDAQFIFEAVGTNCVTVGTHRHGCCVLQRCIDHASGSQKVWLIQQITEHALKLVQDPFGNYVVQYIIDLNEPAFTEPLVHKFIDRIGDLSRHKFSSNVVEKCLRCASDESKDLMIRVLLDSGETDRLLRDSFGNYVIQTALDHSSASMKSQLVNTIRPLLPGIRGTPYGRRLGAKVAQYDAQMGANPNLAPSGQKTSTDPHGGQISLSDGPNRAMTSQSILSPGVYTNGLNGTRAQMSYPTTATVTLPKNPQNAPPQPPRMATYQTYPGTNGAFENGNSTFI